MNTKTQEQWVLETLDNRPIFCNGKGIYTEFRFPGFTEVQYEPGKEIADTRLLALATAEKHTKLALRWRRL